MGLSPDERRDREKVNEAVRRYRESQKYSAAPKPHRPTRDLRHAAARRAVTSSTSLIKRFGRAEANLPR